LFVRVNINCGATRCLTTGNIAVDGHGNFLKKVVI
jgi:hypothetical protein